MVCEWWKPDFKPKCQLKLGKNCRAAIYDWNQFSKKVSKQGFVGSGAGGYRVQTTRWLITAAS